MTGRYIVFVLFLAAIILIITDVAAAAKPSTAIGGFRNGTKSAIKTHQPAFHNPDFSNQASVLQSYIVHVPVLRKPAAFLSKKAWHQGLLSLAEAAASKLHANANGTQINGTVIPSISKRLLYSYDAAYEGFAAQLTKAEAEVLSKMPEVNMLSVDGTRYLHTTHSPAFMNIFSTNGGSISNPGSLFTAASGGSDVIVGLIDSGIWPESASFNDDTGFTPIPARWNGACEEVSTFQGSVVCNKKLIGARTFYQGLQALLQQKGLSIDQIDEYISPRDRGGHGTHTTSTSVGNAVSNAGLFSTYAKGTASGMAPAARVAMYKVCWENYGCQDADIIAAFDAAVSDGVDVISISVGGTDTAYDTSSVSLASFHAVEVGITVIASAGNNGPNLGTVSNAAPWIVTVGASSVDRDFPATVTLGSGDVYQGTSLYSGEVDLGQALWPLVYAGSVITDAALCSDASVLAATGVVQGAVVLCESGDGVGGADKGYAVQQAGGIGMVLISPDNDVWSLVDKFTVPTVFVGYNDGVSIYNYISSISQPSVSLGIGYTRIGATVTFPAPSIATFSSRGPNMISPQLLKPDIIAPGVSILASWSPAHGPSSSAADTRQVDFNIISGTSMACPHVSGILALLKAAHPSWSPAMLRSAIMTTTITVNNQGGSILKINDGNNAAALDMGAGHINPNTALDPGLVYDATAQDYVDFLCILGYNPLAFATSLTCSASPSIVTPGDLNYPSFSIVYLSTSTTATFTFTRTLTNVGPANSVYTFSYSQTVYKVSVAVSSTSLSFGAVDDTQSYSISFTSDPSVFNEIPAGTSYVYADGSVTWSDGAGHDVRSPILFIWALSN